MAKGNAVSGAFGVQRRQGGAQNNQERPRVEAYDSEFSQKQEGFWHAREAEWTARFNRSVDVITRKRR